MQFTTTSDWKKLARLGGGGDWIYRDAHYLVADLELDPEAAARFVPRPLGLAKPARAQLFMAYFPSTTFGSVYREAGIFVEVVHRFTRAIFSPWMLVDDDVALIVGRELLGYPKKLGEFDWQQDEKRIRAVARRRGHALVKMEARIGERMVAPPAMLGRPHRNVRATAGFALPKLIAFTPRERVIEVRRVELDLEIGGSDRDPLHEMGFGRVLGARLHRVDLGGAMLPVPVAALSPISFVPQLLIRSH